MTPPLDVRLLGALRAAEVHQPVGDFARQLAATPEAIRAQLVELRAAGFEIEDRPALGLRLVKAPDRLIAADLRAQLGSTGLVREIVVFEETGSTNDLALQQGRSGAAAGLVIFAERQTAGRGRFGRRWESASHRGLWFSLLLRPEFPLAHWSRLTTWAAVGVAAAIERVTRLPASIKWPNDVYVGDRKVAGILIENGAAQTGAPFAVVGIGVNVNHEADDFPSELAARATSLRIVADRPQDRTRLAVEILSQLEARFSLLAESFGELVREATRRSLLLGRWVQLSSGAGVEEGVAESLEEDGALRLRSNDGGVRRFNAGEVTIIGSRPLG